MERCRHRLRSFTADAADLLPFPGIGIDDGSQASKLEQERFGGLLGTTWDRGQCHLRSRRSRGSLWTLGIGGPVAISPRCSALSESLEPKRGVSEVIRSNELDAHVHRGDASTTNSCRRDWSHVETFSLEDQIREPRQVAYAAELRPEAALHDREVKTTALSRSESA